MQAKKELTGFYGDKKASINEQEKFDELLSQWSESSKELLQHLKKNEGYLSLQKKSKSLLALGAMEAHINMALQALKASKLEE